MIKHALMSWLVKYDDVRLRHVSHLFKVLLFVAVIARNIIMMDDNKPEKNT